MHVGRSYETLILFMSSVHGISDPDELIWPGSILRAQPSRVDAMQCTSLRSADYTCRCAGRLKSARVGTVGTMRGSSSCVPCFSGETTCIAPLTGIAQACTCFKSMQLLEMGSSRVPS